MIHYTIRGIEDVFEIYPEMDDEAAYSTPAKIQNIFDQSKGEDINFVMSSDGGDIKACIEMANIINNAPNKVTFEIVTARSAAAFLMFLQNKSLPIVTALSEVMIHHARYFISGLNIVFDKARLSDLLAGLECTEKKMEGNKLFVECGGMELLKNGRDNYFAGKEISSKFKFPYIETTALSARAGTEIKRVAASRGVKFNGDVERVTEAKRQPLGQSLHDMILKTTQDFNI